MCPSAPRCWSLVAHANPFPSPVVSLPLCTQEPASGSYSSERSAGPGWFWSLHSCSLLPYLSFLDSWVWECRCNWNRTLQNQVDLLTQDSVKLSSVILTGGFLLLIPSSLKHGGEKVSCPEGFCPCVTEFFPCLPMHKCASTYTHSSPQTAAVHKPPQLFLCRKQDLSYQGTSIVWLCYSTQSVIIIT